MTGFTLRVAAYLLLIAGVFQLVVVAIDARGWHRVLLEGGLVERWQAGTIFAAAALATGLAWRAPGSREFYRLVAPGLWIVLFREFDNSALYRMLPSWSKSVAALVIFSGIVAHGRRGIVGAVREQLRHPETLLLVFGAALVLAWAQLLGQPRAWRILCPPDVSPGRGLVEESLELAGHLLILFGLAETYARLRRAAPRA